MRKGGGSQTAMPDLHCAAKRSTVSLYDTAGSHFQPDPVGPFEAAQVQDMATATQHFDSRREIKLKQTYGQPLPPSTYRSRQHDENAYQPQASC